ncbi:MAG: GDSL-type esterase/lipase family protein [Planctomycetota bacterium]
MRYVVVVLVSSVVTAAICAGASLAGVTVLKQRRQLTGALRWLGVDTGLRGPSIDAAYVARIEALADLEVLEDEVLFVGDSLTTGLDVERWFPDVAARNMAIRGETTEDLLYRVETFTAREPAKLILLMGTNDTLTRRSPMQSAMVLDNVIRRIRRVSPATEIVLTTVPELVSPASGSVSELNRQIGRLAAHYSIDVVDLHASLGTDPSLRQQDGVHLSDAAYEKWAALLEPIVIGQ